jgi:hypothetical protein
MAGSKCQLYVNPSRNLKPFLSFILKSAYSCTNIHIKNIQLPVISPFSILFPLKSHHFFFVHLFFQGPRLCPQVSSSIFSLHRDVKGVSDSQARLVRVIEDVSQDG